MMAWITARRLKSGREEEFRTKWAGGDTPGGMSDAYLLQDEEDPRNTLSVSFWDTAEKLLSFRTSEDAKKREDDLKEVVDKVQWNHGYVGFKASDIPTGAGRLKWLIVPVAMAAAGAGAFFLVRRMRAGEGETEDEDQYTWNRETGQLDRPTTAAPTAAEQTGARVHPIVSGNASAPEPRPQTTATSGNPGSAAARRPNMLVRDLMTPNPECVEHDTDLATAAKKMKDLNVGFLPVTADGRLAGVVTDRDITLGLADKDRSAGELRVGDVMSDVPVTVSPHISVDEAAQIMADHQVRRLPVVEGTRVVGILALGALATEGAEPEAGEALEEISEPVKPQR